MHLKVKPKKIIDKSLKDKKIKFVYDNPKKIIVDKEMYTQYNRIFFNELAENTSIKSAFESFGDTSWFERLVLNSYQFSCTKDIANTKLLQELVFKTPDFKEFKDRASEIVDISNDVHLRVEVDSLRRGAVQGEHFRRMEKNKDLYPYFVYKTEDDGNVRDEHAALEGLVFKIGDPEGDSVQCPNGWNCRCHTEPVDDQFLKEEDKQVSKGSDYLEETDPKTGKPYIDEDFRHNPAKQIFPNTGGYFEVFKNANKGNAELFDL